MDINEIFKRAVEEKASDVHFVVGHPPIFRIDGKIQFKEKWPTISQEILEKMIDEIISDEQKKRFLKNKDLDFSYDLEKVARFRISIFQEKGKFSLAARIILPHIPTMEEIMMPEAAYQLARKDRGLVLITGPAGCGKSTSLAAMINLINQERNCRIITLEDPIEYVFPSIKSVIVQRELGTDMVSFAEGLKHIVRQDPNVIMVGEMRDLETIASTITLAETGHLVLATLHTPDAVQTINRLIDVFPAHQQNQIRVQLSLSLNGVIAQKLLPKIGGGRIAAREVLINTHAVAHLIRENKIAQIRSILQTGADVGMFTMDQDIKRLYKEKLISKETAEKYMITPERLDE
ncbi:MAG: type IV pilus twitching motility protein PilT [Patescibacteria group bacterium]